MYFLCTIANGVLIAQLEFADEVIWFWVAAYSVVFGIGVVWALSMIVRRNVSLAEVFLLVGYFGAALGVMLLLTRLV